MGKRVLGSLFGDKLGAVSGALAGSSGVSTASATSILGIAAPAVMGMLGKQLGSNPSPRGLFGLLASSKDAIARFAPAGLLGALGFRNVDELTRKAGGMVELKESAGPRRWMPLLAIAAAILVGLFAWANRRGQVREATGPETTGGARLTSVHIPGGGTLKLQPETFLYNLAAFLDSKDPAPKTFVFDHLNFDPGGTALTPASSATVTDLTKLLNAYPSAQVKLVGFTDNTGDPAANTALSEARAKAVADLLTRGGVAASRLSTEGMGSARPVASNDTEEGRARNRRLELTVVQK
jgi:outer membrane protein OmpA-like peptidoglycan-associated protein